MMAMMTYEICPIFSRELNDGTIDCTRLPAHKAHLATGWTVYERDADGVATAVADLPTKQAAEKWLADHLAARADYFSAVGKIVGETAQPSWIGIDLGRDVTPSAVCESAPDPQEPLICEECARKRQLVIPKRTFPIWRTCICVDCRRYTDVTSWSAYAALRRFRGMVWS
jgi:hypothetical protein